MSEHKRSCDDDDDEHTAKKARKLTVVDFLEDGWESDLSNLTLSCKNSDVPSLAQALKKADWCLKAVRLKCVNLGVKAPIVVTSLSATVTCLKLTGNNIREKGGVALVQALKNNTTLTTLNLSINNLGEKFGKAMGELLSQSSALVMLDLSYNKLGKKGGEAIAKSLESNNSLTWLNLDDNNLAAEPFELDIAAALRRNTTLKELHLSHNLHVGSHGILAIALWDHDFLEGLWLTGNQLNNQAACSFANTLVFNKTLKTLVLSNNRFEDAAGGCFGTALCKNTTLTHLNLCQNKIGYAGARDLINSLKINGHLTVLELEHNLFGAREDLVAYLMRNRRFLLRTEGHDEQWTADVPEDSKCPICFLVARDAVVHECGQLFCERCWTMSPRKNIGCPWCRQDGDAVPAYRERRDISNLTYACQHCHEVVRVGDHHPEGHSV